MTMRRGSVDDDDDDEEDDDDEGNPLISTKMRSVTSASSVEEAAAAAAATAAVGNPYKPMARIAGTITQFCRSDLLDNGRDTADLSDDGSIGSAPLAFVVDVVVQ
jgi:ApbE superfamily uncharacterized protein (UPF0280 family)